MATQALFTADSLCKTEIEQLKKQDGTGPTGQFPSDGNSRNHIRRSSLGSGSGRRGFSGPSAPVCFLSSALGLYVPSILRFFLIRHRSSSRAKLSSDSTANAGEVHACVAMVTQLVRKKGTRGQALLTVATETRPVCHQDSAVFLKLKSITYMENPDND